MQYNSPTKDKQKADLFAPVCIIGTGFNVTSPGKKDDISIRPLSNPNTVTLPLSSSANSLSTLTAFAASVVDFSVSAGKYFDFNY